MIGLDASRSDPRNVPMRRGEVSDAVVMEGRVRRSIEYQIRFLSSCMVQLTSTCIAQGFGFVTFSETSSAESFLGQREHTIEGKRVEAKNAVPKNELGGGGGGGGGYGGGSGRTVPTKIFVGGTVGRFERHCEPPPSSVDGYDITTSCVGRLNRRGYQALFRTVWGVNRCSGEEIRTQETL